jgi:hypothetical protein
LGRRKFPYKIGGKWDPSNIHIREYTAREFREKLKSHGFSIEKLFTTFLGVSAFWGRISFGIPAPILQR